jgi:hypothetical protein
MRRTKGVWLAAVVLCAAAVLAGWPAPARAGKIDEKLAATLGKDVVLAAHPTAQDPALLDYRETTPKEGRLELNLKMKYFGKATSAKYTATIKITIDTTKEPPRVLDLDYKDDNKIPSSKKKLKDVEKSLEKKLPTKL